MLLSKETHKWGMQAILHKEAINTKHLIINLFLTLFRIVQAREGLKNSESIGERIVKE